MSRTPHYRWYQNPPAGFRFSATDAVAIAVCAAATLGMLPLLRELAFLFPVVLFHFFLFCNVFRVRRMPELLWSGFFVANFAGWLSFGCFSWLGVLGTQLPATLTVILVSIFQSDYHGIGYRLVPWGRRPDERREGDRATGGDLKS